MQAATPYLAIVAIIISLGNLFLYFLTYNKAKGDANIQRRDHLSQAISELNARVNEAYMISARYEIVAVKRAGLPLRGEQAAHNTTMIASIKKMTEGIGQDMKTWNENIKRLHLIYSNLTSDTDAAKVESYITMVNVASDDLKKYNEGFLSWLHILETTNQMLETKLAETDEKIRQINLDADEKIRQINLNYEQRLKSLGY